VRCEDLTVVTNLLDHLVSEVGGQAKTWIQHGGTFVRSDLQTKEALDADVFAGSEGVNVGAGDSELFSLNGGQDCPVDDLCPLGVAIQDCRCEGLLGEDLGENQQSICSAGVCRAQTCQLADIRRPAITLSSQEGFQDEVGLVEGTTSQSRPKREDSSAALPSVVVPLATQTTAPFMSETLA